MANMAAQKTNDGNSDIRFVTSKTLLHLRKQDTFLLTLIDPVDP